MIAQQLIILPKPEEQIFGLEEELALTQVTSPHQAEHLLQARAQELALTQLAPQSLPRVVVMSLSRLESLRAQPVCTAKTGQVEAELIQASGRF
jgi:hypothetical protein